MLMCHPHCPKYARLRGTSPTPPPSLQEQVWLCAKTWCFRNSLRPHASPPPLCTGDDQMCSLGTLSSRRGACLNRPGMDVQGNLLFGNLLCQTALRCLEVLVVIVSFPKGARREGASAGRQKPGLPRDRGVCVLWWEPASLRGGRAERGEQGRWR